MAILLLKLGSDMIMINLHTTIILVRTGCEPGLVQPAAAKPSQEISYCDWVTYLRTNQLQYLYTILLLEVISFLN